MGNITTTKVNAQTPVYGILQRKCGCGQHAGGGECTECRKKRNGVLQRRAANMNEPTTVPPIVHEVLRSPGQPLDARTRAFFELRFGHDFSRVRVHTSVKAVESAEAVNALAYTVGRDIVFASGHFAPETDEGRRLLAHELTHVLQQSGETSPPVAVSVGQPENSSEPEANAVSQAVLCRQKAPKVTSAVTGNQLQRKTDYFGPTSGAPADWKTKVDAAKTSADRATLIQTVVGLTVSDATAASATDASPDATHLKEYSASSQTINYDDGLNSKTSPVDGRSLKDNAGYTLHSTGKYYIILGPKAIDADRYYYALTVLSHEFDHVRQEMSGSKLKGNESELDAWTSSFIRDFHRSYLLGDTGTTCFVQSVTTFTPLLDYYRKSDVSDVQRNASVRRITDYYKTTVSGQEGHKRAFRFWIHRSLKLSITPNLAERLNTELKLGINAAEDLKTTRQFPCDTLKSLSYSPPTLDKPTFPSPTSKPTTASPKSEGPP